MYGAIGIEEFATPCYAGLKDTFIFGNNLAFVQRVIQTLEGRAGSIVEQAHYRSAQRRFREYGLSRDEGPVHGLFFPATIYDTLDALIPGVSNWRVDQEHPDQKIREDVVRELNRSGQPLDEAEIKKRFDERHLALRKEREGIVRAQVAVLRNIVWIALQAVESPKGMSIRLALELR